jgi:hypothetical protein
MSTYKESRTIRQGQSLSIHRRWYDLFLDPLCSNPPRLNLGLGGSGLEDSFPFKSRF